MDMKLFNKKHSLQKKQVKEVVEFLYTGLEKYGDPARDIKKAVEYALSEASGKGGFVLVSYAEEQISGVVVVNHTGMTAYIPENILVYIAIRKDLRGIGIGKTLLTKTIELVDGNIALHVEQDNPAKFLYEKLGFENKYLEMRYKKN